LARVTHSPKITVQVGQDVYNESNFYMADPDFLNIFDLPLIAGNRQAVLQDLNSVIISEEISHKIFEDEDPIGKTLELGGQHMFQVSGVFENMPLQSHVSIDYLVSFQNLERLIPGTSLTENWGQFNYFAYLMIDDAELEQEVEGKISATVISPGTEDETQLEELNLQPLLDIHFTANRGNAKPSYDAKYLLVYLAIALATLIISIINFINLTIAGSTKRIREVGIRKVIGARRHQLMLQYISEALFTTITALLFALPITYVFLIPASNNVFLSDISLDLTEPGLILILLVMTIAISLLAGFYIAVFVTGYEPSRALLGDLKIGGKGNTVKNILLGGQFAISLILILSSIFIFKQLDYLQVKDLGLQPAQVINISLYNKNARDNVGLLKTRINSLPWVEGITATRFTAGSANWHQTAWWEGQKESESMSVILADEGFVNALSLVAVEGDQKLIETLPSEGEVRYILNEAAREHIGWETALGKSFYIFGENSLAPISGVVEDFNFKSLHQQIDPVVIAVYDRIQPGQLMVKVATDDYRSALSKLSDIFTSTVPNTPFEYHFLDEQFQELYQAEYRTGKVVGVLTTIAILLALLGLYGLVSFVVQERTKEMAIRRILGIKLPSILALLSIGYLKLLFLANLVAIPVVWYIVDGWLNNFSYRIQLSPLLFLVGSAIVWAFVLVTVSINVLHVARIDPADGLRHE